MGPVSEDEPALEELGFHAVQKMLEGSSWAGKV
jgi:hypothetical protein